MADKKPLKTENGKTKQFTSTDTVPPENLGSGTRDGTKFLRDDGTYQVPTGGLTQAQLLARLSIGF